MRRQTVRLLLIGLLILVPALRAETPCVWTGVGKIVAVGDIHGDYNSFLIILKGTGVIDEGLSWAAGTTHFVQTGDIMDRGPDARRIFDLLRRLEKEAEAAGGHVHVLIGNHEEMNLSGIAFDYPDYVTVEQFRSFLPENYIRQKEEQFLRRWRIAPPPGADRNLIPAEDLLNLWAQVLDTDQDARSRYLDFFRRNYGNWISGHNAVIKINDTVFVHGGISAEYSIRPLSEINDDLRKELRFVLSGRNFVPRILYARDGPLWYRELAQRDEALFEDEVNSILANLQARNIVIAHTVVGVATAKNMRRFGGKVWVIDTGISAYYQGQLSALIIEEGLIKAWGVSDE